VALIEMFGINASRSIALMQYVAVIRDGSNKDKISKSRCSAYLTSPTDNCSMKYPAITIERARDYLDLR
jgi:hypothetical protein